MIFIVSVLAVFVLVIMLALYWAFKTAFMRSDIRLVSFESGPLAEYKSVFDKSLNYIEKLPCEVVTINSFDDIKLVGNYYSNNSDTTILLFHGYRSDGKFDFACAVKFYIELGLNVLVVDQRGNGKSEGKLITFGIKERHDAQAWTNYIAQRYAPRNIFLSGVSMGASTVMMAANLELPESVKGIIADCGFTSPPSIIKKVAKQSFKINAEPILPILNVMCKLFGKFNLYEIDTTRALSESNIPIFFIHGKCDGFVPCEMTEISYNASCAEKYICLVENADHGISFLVDTDNVQKQITNFIQEHCS